MIRLRGVGVELGGRVVLDGLDLDLPDASVTAVMGPNGSGKTTLARVLLGLVEPTSGTVEGLTGLARAAVFQEDRLVGHLDAVANVRLVLPRAVPTGHVVDALVATGLAGADLTAPVRALSGGQRRRAAVVRALLTDADLVVLDEPFTGLDGRARRLTRTLVRERCARRTTVLVTHDADDVAWFGARLVTLPTAGTPAPIADAGTGAARRPAPRWTVSSSGPAAPGPGGPSGRARTPART